MSTKLSGPLLSRLATAPISWGICEVPGWGEQMSVERVLREMDGRGFPATELGSFGWLPTEAQPLRSLLESHDLSLIAGWVSLVLHEPAEADAALETAREMAELLADAGATFFNTAPITDHDWSGRTPLSDSQWDHLSFMLAGLGEIVDEKGLRQVVHPHINTVVETADEIERVLESTTVDFILDTAHFAVGGCDPLAFAQQHGDRIGMVHLKDLNNDIAQELNAGTLSLLEATQAGIFRPLGRGDLPIADVVAALEGSGYDGWYVLEQDVALTEGMPPEGSGPMLQVEESLDYLRNVETSLNT